MKTLARIIAILVGAHVISACGGSADEPTGSPLTSEERLIGDYLSATRQITREQIEIRNDRVFVDSDAFFDKQALLDEIALVGFDAGPGQSLQGYFYNSNLKTNMSPRAEKVFYSFSAAVPETWRASFRAAAAAWGAASASDCVGFQEGTGSAGQSQIKIGVGEAGTAANGGPAAAVASFPISFSIPHVISQRILTGSSITIDTGSVGLASESARLGVAVHELGHTLGFTHPWDGTLIAGSTKNGNSSCCSATYTTVMDYRGTTALSSDDLVSLAKRFKKQSVPLGRQTVQTCAYEFILPL